MLGQMLEADRAEQYPREPASVDYWDPTLLSSREYAERVATRLLEVLLDVEQYRGTGRLYLP